MLFIFKELVIGKATLESLKTFYLNVFHAIAIIMPEIYHTITFNVNILNQLKRI